MMPIITALAPTILKIVVDKAAKKDIPKKPTLITESAYLGVYTSGKVIYTAMIAAGGLTLDNALAIDPNLWGAFFSAAAIATVRFVQKLQEQKEG